MNAARLIRASRPPCVSICLLAYLSFTLLCAVSGRVGTSYAADRTTTEHVATEAASATDLDALRFRRAFVPAGRVNEWPRGEDRYLPMDIGEFERLMRLAVAGQSAAAVATMPTIEQASYEATLDRDTLIDGHATLDVRQQGDGTAVLPVDNCSLAISHVRWNDDDKIAAIIGRTANMGAGLVVDRSGELTFRWSLRATHREPGDLEFDVRLPPGPSKRLLLHLPEGTTLQSDVGIVTPSDDRDDSKRTWQVDLGGRSSAIIRVTSETAVNRSLPSVLLRQHLNYVFSPRGVDVAARFSLQPVAGDDTQRFPRRLRVEVDPRLVVIDVRSAGTALRWHPVNGNVAIPRPTDDVRPATAAHRMVAYEIELPPSTDNRLDVRLSAVAPLELATLWQLPSVLASGVYWIAGDAVLHVDPSLALDELRLSAGRQVAPPPLDNEHVETTLGKANNGEAGFDRAGARIAIQFFRPDGHVEVRLADVDQTVGDQRDSQVTSRTGTTYDLAERQTTSQIRTEFFSTGPRVFNLNASIADDWTVTAVASEPPDLATDWHVTDTDDGNARLMVRLALPLTRQRPVLLTVSAASRRGYLTAVDLPVLDFGFRELKPPLVQARVAPFLAGGEYRLNTSGAEQHTRLDPALLPTKDRKLLDGDGSGVLFQALSVPETLRIALSPERANYSAEVFTDVHVDGPLLTETHRFRCQIESQGVRNVMVQFAGAGHADTDTDEAGPWTWSLKPNGEQPIVAKPAQDRQTSSTGAGYDHGETWTIPIRGPSQDSVDIYARRTRPFVGKTAVYLASLPEATSQRGVLTIRAPRFVEIRSDQRRLKPIPSPQLPSLGRASTVRGTFRFDPAREARSGDAPAVTLLPNQTSETPSHTYVWHAELDAWRAVDGVTDYRARYFIESVESRGAEFRLPEGATVDGVWLNQQRLSSASTADARTVKVTLPSQNRFVTLLIRYRTKEPPLGAMGTIAIRRPTTQLPVLGQQTTLWLPPGYDAHGQHVESTVPLPISRRLLGLFGRSNQTPPFNPFDSQQWLATARADTMEPDRLGQAKSFVGRLGQSVPASSPHDTVSWATWLSEAAAPSVTTANGDTLSTSHPSLLLLVDHQSLAAVGIDHATPVDGRAVAPQWNLDVTDLGRAILERAGAVLLTHPDGLIVTTSTFVARFRDQLERTSVDGLLRVKPGRLSDVIATRRHLLGGGPLVDVTLWHGAALQRNAMPWFETGMDTRRDPAGWSGFTVRHLESPSTSVRVVRRSSMNMIGMLAFIGTLVLMAWTSKRSQATTIMLLAVASIATLGTPPAYVPITSGVMLGVLASFLVVSLKRSGSLPTNLASAQRELARAGTSSATRLLLTLAWCATGTAMYAQDASQAVGPVASDPLPAAATRDVSSEVSPIGSQSKRSSTASLPIVLIPVDQDALSTFAKGSTIRSKANQPEPIDGQVYVPERLFRPLHRFAEASKRQPGAWLIAGATYHGKMIESNTADRLAIDSIRAVFDLETYMPAAQVRIPFSRRDATLPTEAVQLDGRPVAWRQLPDGSLSVTVDRPGVYQLTVHIQPTITAEGDIAQFTLPIIPLVNARLSLALSNDLRHGDSGSIDVPTARGRVSMTPDHSWLSADLGATDRLRVQWATQIDTNDVEPNLEVSELLWLHVHPGAAVLDVKYRIKVVDGPLRTLRLATDPHLQLLPPDLGSPIASVRRLPQSGDDTTTNLWALSLREPAADEISLPLRFLVVAESGTGVVSLPEIKLLTATPVRRLFGISVDNALSYIPSAPSGMEKFAAAQFADHWALDEPNGGELNLALPQFAFELTETTPAWSLSTQPRKTLNVADQQITLDFDQRSANLWFDAQIETTSQRAFLFTVRCPKSVAVHDVSVQNGENEVAARWSRDDRGTLTVFLTHAVTGVSQLTIRGTMDFGTTGIPAGGEISIPAMELTDCDVRSRQLALYRRSGVLLELKRSDSLRSIELARRRNSLGDNTWRFGNFEQVGPTATPESALSAIVRVSPNQPQYSIRQMTTLQLAGGSWEATIDLLLEVNQGIVDSVQLAVPARWEGPFEMQSTDEPLRLETTLPLASPSRPTRERRLQVPVPRFAGGQHRIRIRAPLPTNSAQQVRLPDVRPLGTGDVVRYVSLPRAFESQSIQWETTGLSAAPRPDGFATDESAASPDEVYKIVDKDYYAQLGPKRPITLSPRVRLADIRITIDHSVLRAAVATFDLEPAGRANCVLRMPADARLLRVTVAGLPADPVAAGELDWQLTLGPPRLPQRLQVVYTARDSAHLPTQGEVLIQSPRILFDNEETKAEQTLWTIHSDRANVRSTSPNVQQIDAVDQEWTRLESIAEILDLAPAEANRMPPIEVAHWYRPWSDRMNWSKQRIALDAHRNATDDDTRSRLEEIIADQRVVAQNLGTEQVLAESLTTVSAPRESGQLLALPLNRDRITARFVATGSAPVLSLRYEDPTTDDLVSRSLASGLVLVIAALTYFASRRGLATDLFRLWPHAWGVVLGLAWWLWLSPSFVGLLIVLAVLVHLGSEPIRTALRSLRSRQSGESFRY